LMIARNNMNKNNAFHVYSINGEDKGTPWDEFDVMLDDKTITCNRYFIIQ
jgi:hypothetical protein